MFDNNYYFAGMHAGWWILLALLLVWIFATPYDIPFQRKKKRSALDVLKHRFASGLINKEQFAEHKLFIEKDLIK